MRFGLITPIVTLVPHRHAAWEETAGVPALRRIAQIADALGFHHLTCSDHVAVPAAAAQVRGARYYDPFSTLGYLAAVTEKIRLVTHVLVLPYYHPLEVAKRLGSLDRLSGGRVIAGLGVGTLREEFELLGARFEGRGDRYEDALRALRAALGLRQPEYSGPHFHYAGMIIDPCAQQPHIPIWLGGRTRRSLRRAFQFGDGWDPFGLSLAQVAEMLANARQSSFWRSPGDSFALVLAADRLIDVESPQARADTIEFLAHYERLGATHMNLQFHSRSLEHLLDQLARFADEVMPRFTPAS